MHVRRELYIYDDLYPTPHLNFVLVFPYCRNHFKSDYTAKGFAFQCLIIMWTAPQLCHILFYTPPPISVEIPLCILLDSRHPPGCPTVAAAWTTLIPRLCTSLSRMNQQDQNCTHTPYLQTTNYYSQIVISLWSTRRM